MNEKKIIIKKINCLKNEKKRNACENLERYIEKKKFLCDNLRKNLIETQENILRLGKISPAI